jgi:hypothetical protein
LDASYLEIRCPCIYTLILVLTILLIHALLLSILALPPIELDKLIRILLAAQGLTLSVLAAIVRFILLCTGYVDIE